MGAWGTTLYANDTASDVRDDFMELLRKGHTKEEATKLLIARNADLFQSDRMAEEAALFWYALADTQWNRGMLLPQVKQAAMDCLQNRELEQQRWLDSGEQNARKYAERWMQTLDALQQKLQQLQPKEKKARPRRLYHCPWELGDVFAYRFTSEYSRENGFYGKYCVFRKISEQFWYPGHLDPLVKLYAWIGDTPPTLEDVKKAHILPSIMYKNLDVRTYRFFWLLITRKAKEIPQDNLTWIGNLPGPDLLPYRSKEHTLGMWFHESSPIGWDNSPWNHKIEREVIRQYEEYVTFPEGFDSDYYAQQQWNKVRERYGPDEPETPSASSNDIEKRR